MLASFIIVLREVLEATLVVSICLAATSGVAGSRRAIALGLGAGLAGAVAVAAAADTLTVALAGMGQEVFKASVLLLAVLMLAWHHAWMRRHGSGLARRLRQAGNGVRDGSHTLTALALVVALAVLREGAEVVLFLHGIAAGGTGSGSLLAGGLLGLAGGAALATLIYRGLVRIPARQLFAVTGWLLVCLAAGMSAQAAALLVQAGWLPGLVEPVWDTSAWLPVQSPAGEILHALVGYDDRPSAMQLLWFAGTFGGILVLGRWINTGRPAAGRAAVPGFPSA